MKLWRCPICLTSVETPDHVFKYDCCCISGHLTPMLLLPKSRWQSILDDTKVQMENIPRCNKCKRESSDLSLGLCLYCIGNKPIDISKDKVFDPTDKINPQHYRKHPSGIECIEVTRHLSFNIGNAIKYLWRCDLKNGVEDLKKAVWYINDEIKRREKQSEKIIDNSSGSNKP